MEGSAAAVGRIMAVILGAQREGEAFARLGVAFQLTNFVRDVRVDYGLDRIYLPAEELIRFGVVPADLGLDSASPQLRALLAAEVRGQEGTSPNPSPRTRRPCRRRGRACGSRAAAYLAVLDRIEAVDYDVLRRTIRPGPHGLTRAALAALKQDA
jgi:phytoene synthase